MKNFDLSLYLVTDRSACLGRELTDVVKAAIDGGVTMVQVREKKCSTDDFIRIAASLQPVCQQARVPLIINDNIDVALAINADGVHIGQDDSDLITTRERMGDTAIIGLSITSEADALRFVEQQQAKYADYVGIGPVFGTATKPDAAKPCGLNLLRRWHTVCAVPSVAIGGIDQHNAGCVMKTGTNGIAVITAICSADDARAATAQLKQIIAPAS